MKPLKLTLHSLLLSAWLIAAVHVVADSVPKSHQELQKADAFYDNEALVTYVRAVGRRVADHSDAPSIDYQFFVIDDASVNAMAIPEGYIYVHRGLLAFLESEDQLAAVLGHEIGHVTAKHGASRQGNQTAIDILGFIASLVTLNGGVGEVVKLYGQESAQGRGRTHELEADHLGAQAIARTGYDPMAMFDVLQVLKDQEVYGKQVEKQSTTYHGVFSSHPKSDRRLQEIISEAQAASTGEVAEPIGDFLTMIDGMTYGNSGARGAVRDNKYYHGRMGFVLEYPTGWVLSSSALKIVGYPPEGSAGGYISMELDQAELKWTPKEFVEKRLKPGALTNEEEFTIKDEQEDLKGFRATVTLTDGESGSTEIGVIYKDGRAYVFKAETRDDKKVQATRDAMKYVMDHFRRITFQDLKEATTEKIALVSANPSDTYESLAKQTPLGRKGAEQLRLLNGDFPNGEPRAGDRIKVVK